MSLLSALLTQDQVVSPKVIDEAIQRQVISGGDLETNLLELGVILEDTLASYTAAVLALQPATRDEVFSADPAVAARLPVALAERYQMAALRVENGRVVIATCRAVTYEIRAEVEAATGYAAEFRGVTSVRLAWALWRYYQVPLTPRMLKLNERLQSMPSGGTAEVTFPLTRPKANHSPNPQVPGVNPASSAFAALDRALREEDSIPPASRSSLPPPTSQPPQAPSSQRPATTADATAARAPTHAWEVALAGRDATATVPDPTNPPSAPHDATDAGDVGSNRLSPHRSTSPWIALPPTPIVPIVPVAPPSTIPPGVDGHVHEAPPRVRTRSILHAPTPAIHVEPPPEAFPEPPQPPPSTRPLPPTSSPSVAPPPMTTPPTSSASSPSVPAPPSAPPNTVPAPFVPSSPGPAVTSRPPTSPPPAEEPHVPHRMQRPSSRPPSRTNVPAIVVPPPSHLERGITLAEATRRLAEATDRDAVIEATLDHLWHRFEYVAAFVVQGDQAHGLASRGEGAYGDALHRITVPLRTTGVFQTAWEHGTVEVEQIATYTPEYAVREALGRVIADEAIVAPVRVAQKVVLLLWADAGAQSPSALAMRDLGRFVQSCADAFMRVIAQKKRLSQPSIPVRSSPPTPILASLVAPAGSQQSGRPAAVLPDRDTRLEVLRQALTGAPPARSPSDLSAPPQRASSSPALTPAPGADTPVTTPAAAVDTLQPPTGTSPSGDSFPALGTTEAERIVSEVVATGELTEAMIATLLGHGERALGVIFRHFPGPHTIQRSEAAHRLPVLEERGPLLRLVVTFRQAAIPRLLAALNDPSEDKRFCALLCLNEVVHPTAIPRLIPKLTDPDYPTRMAAIEVLRNYRRFDEFELVGRTLRQTLRDVKVPPDQRRSAAYALGELRDTDAIPELVATLTDSDPALSSAAQRALIVLTRQDFGTSPQPWLEWWDRAASRHRIEWLIDALLHQEATIRHDASEELKKLTGQYFGYYFNLPRRERERAHQRYVEWWRTEGAERFSGRAGV